MPAPVVLNMSLAVRLMYADGTQAVVSTVPQEVPHTDFMEATQESVDDVLSVLFVHYETVRDQIKHDGLTNTYIRAKQEAAARRAIAKKTASGSRAAHALENDPMQTTSEVLVGLGNLVEAHIARNADSPFVEAATSGQGMKVVVRDKEGVRRAFNITVTEAVDGPTLGTPLRPQEAAGPACAGKSAQDEQAGVSDAGMTAAPVQEERQPEAAAAQ